MQSQSTSSAHWPRSLQATGNPLVASARFMEDLTIGSLFLPVDLALSRLSSFSSIKVQADKRMLLSTPQRTAYASRDEKKRTFEERIASAFHEDGRVEVVALRAAVNSTEPRRFLDFATAYLRNELSPEAIMAFKASIAEQGGFVKFKTIPAGAATDRSLRNRSVYSDQARVYYLSTDDRKELVRIGLETVKILGKFEGREVQQNALFDAVVPGRAGISFDNYQTQYRGEVQPLKALMVPQDFKPGEDLEVKAYSVEGLPRGRFSRRELVYAITLKDFGVDALKQVKAEFELGFGKQALASVKKTASELAQYLKVESVRDWRPGGFRERVFNEFLKNPNTPWQF